MSLVFGVVQCAKTVLCSSIRRASGVSYRDMVFFDDEERNVRDISSLGVTCVLIDEDVGLDYDILKSGLREFNNKH